MNTSDPLTDPFKDDYDRAVVNTLMASNIRERSARELFNPQLSEFSKSQLSIALKALLTQQIELRKHVDSLSVYPSLVPMMKEKIEEYESEISELSEIIVQFAGAIHHKENEEKRNAN